MYICGQKKLLERIDTLIEQSRFPRFCILIGGAGFGKKVISDYIARKLNAVFVPCETTAESVRNTVENAYTTPDKTLYMFYDCDTMSESAENSLLKVTEEPPNDSYFIMTFSDISNVIATILNRGTVFFMDAYSEDDIREYIARKHFEFNEKLTNVVYNVCVCPADVQNADKCDIESVYDLANKFMQFIGNANLANELKIAQSLSTKQDDGKMNPMLFMRCVLYSANKCIIRGCNSDDAFKYHSIISETVKAIRDLQTKGANRQIVIDNWIINTHMAVSET